MNKSQGKSRILCLIIKRNQIEKTNVIISLNAVRLSVSQLEESINANVHEYQGLLQTVTSMMGSNKLLDSLLWHERMQYAQELKNINRALTDKVNALHLEIKGCERKIEILTAKGKSLERKMIFLNGELGLKRMKTEEVVLSDLYAVYSVRS